MCIPLISVAVERVFSGARDFLPYSRNRMGYEMIRGLMLHKSWNSIHVKYAAEAENIPAHFEEGLVDLDDIGEGLKRRALRYNTEFLCRMILSPLDEQAGLGHTDSEADSGTEVKVGFEVDDDLADTSSHVSQMRP